MPPMQRKASVTRKTTETNVSLELSLDGNGVSKIKTGIPFFDHMLTLFSRHGLMDLKIKAKGDIDVDFHHTVEDVGLCLGEALKKALGGKSGIKRYGSSNVPMMDALAMAVLDIGGRPNLKLTVPPAITPKKKSRARENFDMGLTEEFLKAFSNSASMDLHIVLRYGKDLHHSIEAIFKALGRALRQAVEVDPRIKGVMSTKGKL